MSKATLNDWEAVVAFAMRLDGAELATSYGKPAIKVSDRMIVAPSSDPGSFVLMVAADEKEMLLATDPATFWQTDHYLNWPALLVRYAATDVERVRMLITRAWWDRAGHKRRTAFGDRP